MFSYSNGWLSEHYANKDLVIMGTHSFNNWNLIESIVGVQVGMSLYLIVKFSKSWTYNSFKFLVVLRLHVYKKTQNEKFEHGST